MKASFSVMIRLLLLISVVIDAYGYSAKDDRFNYRETVGTDFGPADWAWVRCVGDDIDECQGWPDSWELGVGWSLRHNTCQWCPETGNSCLIHRQSPINLERSNATTGHDPQCMDDHWMAYHDGSCNWHDIVKNPYSIHSNNFKIERHALQIMQPVDESGELQCLNHLGERNFPMLDYSNGFPSNWLLSHTEVTVPSEHTQEGKRFAAEVHLSHFYSVFDFRRRRQLGKVVLFLEPDASRERWDFLDKLICQWREVEEQNRDECGLESVPSYPGCRNPTREAGETDLPHVDPYPFIDCDSVENSQRMCKPNSCCESKRSDSDYCQEKVYDKYGDEIVGSICWWCCPGKVLAPPEPTSAPEPTSGPSIEADVAAQTTTPTIISSPPSATEKEPTAGPSTATPTSSPSVSFQPSTGTPTVFSSVSVTPSTAPSTAMPTASPSVSDQPTTAPPTAEPPTTTPSVPVEPIVNLECSDYDNRPDMNMNKICAICCDAVRSSMDHCHLAYKVFGDHMEDVCSDCCQPSREVGPPPPEHPIYPPIDCTTVTNPFRTCKKNSCCDSFPATNNKYCEEVYEDSADDIESICWYCCSEPIDINELESTQNPPTADQNRNLKLRSRQTKDISVPQQQEIDVMKSSDTFSGIQTSEVVNSKKLRDTENTHQNDFADKEDKKRRKAQPKVQEKSRRVEETLTGDNYIDVPYSPYEWMREVKTEYYFRYEGTQMVPPCYGLVHYRVMKDPIRIHPDQLAELERLLAWRIAPKGSKFNECQRDTAGKDRPGSNGNAVDLNRPLQGYNDFHLKVFCECKDWESQFQEDLDWCKLSDDERYRTHPYNYDSGGTF